MNKTNYFVIDTRFSMKFCPKAVHSLQTEKRETIIHTDNRMPIVPTMKNSKTLTLVCFGIMVLSLFLPFYEGPRPKSVFPENPVMIYETYYSPYFGLRIWVFNGLGSLFAWTNLALGLILVCSRFFFPRSFAVAIATAVVFAGAIAFLIYDTSEKPGIVLADEMRIGFYLVLVSQVVLITQSFTSAITAPPPKRQHHTDLLDF